MKSGCFAMIGRLLIVSLLFFSFQSTAGMIGTEQVARGRFRAGRAHADPEHALPRRRREPRCSRWAST